MTRLAIEGKSRSLGATSMKLQPLLFVTATVLIGSAATTFTTFAQNSPQDYPQWRGWNRDGAASAFAEPKPWPEKLTRKWKVVVGDGYATPIVVGNRVYAFTRRESNE